MANDKITLWQETVDMLERNGKSWADVESVRIANKQMDKKVFEKHAKKISYQPWCYGINTINLALRLYGDGFVMARHEYDGQEWWDFWITKPAPATEITTSRKDLLESIYLKI